MAGSGKLIKTVFQTGPDDSLAAEDVYEGGGSPENTYDDKRGGAIDTMDAIGDSSNQPSTPASFESATESSTAPQTYSSSEAMQRMAASSSSVAGFLNNLSQTAKDLFNLIPAQSNVIAGSQTVNSFLPINDIKAVVDIISNLSNNNFDNNVVDNGGQTQLIATTITAASNAGINGGFQAIEKNPSIDRNVLADSAAQAIEQTVAVGNIGVVLDVSQTDLMSNIITRKPGIVQTILSSPSITNVPLRNQNVVFKVIKDAIDKADPGWNTTNINGQTLVDLKDMKISQQMKELIRYNIFELPLTVEVGDENSSNPAVDVELGPNGDVETIADYKKSVAMLAGSQFPIISVKSALDIQFEYLGVETNNLITRQKSSLI